MKNKKKSNGIYESLLYTYVSSPISKRPLLQPHIMFTTLKSDICITVLETLELSPSRDIGATAKCHLDSRNTLILTLCNFISKANIYTQNPFFFLIILFFVLFCFCNVYLFCRELIKIVCLLHLYVLILLLLFYTIIFKLY